MYDSIRYDLRITAARKGPGPTGHQPPGYDYNVRLVWDDMVVVDGTVHSPEALGRLVGDAVRVMAECYEQSAPTSRCGSCYPRPCHAGCRTFG